MTRFITAVVFVGKSACWRARFGDAARAEKLWRAWAGLMALGLVLAGFMAHGQSLGNAGTITGLVTDPTGATIGDADVTVTNALSGYKQTVKSAADGTFRLINIPPNQYHLAIDASGFNTFTQDITIRNSVPIQVTAALKLAGSTTEVTVQGAADALETDPSAHVDVDRSQLAKMMSSDPGGGLSSAITNSSGGVVADANGFFHPVGDHAQTSFVIDGQPISDQQSKVFSTQLPTSAIASMDLITGTPNAEFGDKTSLVAEVTTRSGLGAGKLFGNIGTSYGSFGNVSGTIGLGFGSAKVGNFIAIDGVRSGRFLDTPQFAAFHDVGNNQTIFDRFDFQPNGKDAIHLNLFLARNWIQIPNDYDQLSQDQRQRVLTWSIAPGYQHTFSAHALLSVNPYIRKDQFNYYPSREVFDDSPFTQNEFRQLLNWGVKSDLSVTEGKHNMKFGIDLKQTRLLEDFGFAVTDPNYNPVCVNPLGDTAGPPTVLNPNNCAGLGLTANPNLQPGLVPFDLTRGGTPFAFHDAGNINQYAFFAQDSITVRNLSVNFGIREDVYDGLTFDHGIEPRAGIAYNIRKTGTVLRVSYARTFETPFNENLLLSSATGAGGLAQNVFGAASEPIRPGRRNQFNTGVQQAIGKWLLIDADYFWKYTHNAYDFDVLFNTTITFPIAWHNSKLDGVTGRVSTTNIHGFQTYFTFGHTRARFFGPEVGGLVPQSELPTGVFRIDHDQEFQSTLNMRYQRPRNAEWIAFTFRFDSGEVVSGVPDVAAALQLTAAQQATIGFACNGVAATFSSAIQTCNGTGTSKLITLPQTGTENDDHNPDRVKPRALFNIGVGTDNLLHAEGLRRITASVEITNLTNKEALYNFLSTFSGTHFVPPREVVARVGVTF